MTEKNLLTAREQMVEPPLPNAFIQWKGTEVCMDIYCTCGFHGHIDDDFVYNVKCPRCGTVYACNPHITLVPLEAHENQDNMVIKELEDNDK